MRFKFCGDLDCPDWVLAGINLLSRLSSLKLKMVCSVVMKNLLGEELDMAKLQKATADAKFDDAELRASVSVLVYVLSSGSRHGVSVGQLSEELQQLGLPREHAASLGRVFDQSAPDLLHRLRRQTLKLPGVERVEWTTGLEHGEPRVPVVHLTLTLDTPVTGTSPSSGGQQGSRTVNLQLTRQTATLLRNELLIAKRKMDSL